MLRKSLLLTLVALSSSAQGAIVLLGGFHGENETAQQSPSISDITVTLTRTGTSSDITQGFSQINSALWGTQALDVAAADSNAPAAHAIFQSQVVDASDNPQPITLLLTITNSGTSDLLLDQIHFNLKKDINNVGPSEQTVTYTSGDLSDTDGTNTGVFALANGVNPYDVDLSSFLTDTTLSAGESATFEWSHGLAQDPTGNTAIRMDNFAISGEVIPEPSSLLLGGLGALLLLRRRCSA